MPKHILIISQYFHPETFRINDIAQEWTKRGYRISVLTGIPNYPEGKFFPGYSFFRKRKEKWGDIEITRIPLTPRGHSAVGMVLNYYSFVISGWFWNRFTRQKADIVFSFETSPMTQLKIGCGYARKHKVPHIMYVQDLWPENVEVAGGIHNKRILGYLDRMVDKIYQQADKILLTSPSFRESVMHRKKPVPPEKLVYWPQYAEDFYRPLPRKSIPEIPDDGMFNIVFTGNLGTAQGLDVLPRTARLLADEAVRFIIVGDGRYRESLEKEIEQLDVRQKFLMIPRQPAERIPEILSACDAGFISFAQNPLWEKTIPAKLQSYLACGKAVIASASGETKRIIEEAKCGIVTETGNAEALAEGVRSMLSADLKRMGECARKYFEAHFDKKLLMDRMDHLIKEMAP